MYEFICILKAQTILGQIMNIYFQNLQKYFIIIIVALHFTQDHAISGYCPLHLCFKQAQPKMYHSPKVDDGVDIFLF